jgi:sterol desaturase/sphingolipid hydroxylase (fatty acid hydroxylase superfamily)
MNSPDQHDHWLVRPTTIRLLWWVFGAVLAGLVALQLVIKVKGYFGVDEWLAFGAAFGFGACLVMVLVAKGLGVFLKRPDNYYQNDSSKGAEHD